MFVEKFYINAVYFFNGNSLPSHTWISDLVAVENESKLLLTLAILQDSAPIAE